MQLKKCLNGYSLRMTSIGALCLPFVVHALFSKSYPLAILSENGKYKSDASKNITNWKTSLFARTMELQRNIDMNDTAVNLFDIFSTVVQCPSNEKLVRVGGTGDGKCLFVLLKCMFFLLLK